MVRGHRKQHATREEAEETKRTILRTAQQLFMEYGYRAVSTRQLADACGLTQPALYHYFSDKQDLYVAMVQEEVAKLKAALERIAGRGEGVEERLRRIGHFLLSTTQHDLALMLHDIRHELTLERQAVLDEAFQAGVISPIAAVFREGLQQGLLRDVQHDGMDPYTATYMFMNMISRYTRRPATSDRTQAVHSASDAERANAIVQVLLYGLAYPRLEDGQHHSTHTT